jgi:hypothetical protein
MKNRHLLITGLFVIMLCIAGMAAGCKNTQLESGGAYAPAVTNAAGQVTPATQPEQALYVSDAAYKLAFDTVIGVMNFERDNREDLKKISPQIKTSLDKIRPTVAEINHRWALARKAYKANPTPAGLSTVQGVVAEIVRLVPVVQAELAPVYSSVTKPQ